MNLKARFNWVKILSTTNIYALHDSHINQLLNFDIRAKNNTIDGQEHNKFDGENLNYKFVYTKKSY